MLMAMSVTNKMHERTSQKHQKRQRGQNVARMGPKQIAAQGCEQQTNNKAKFRMKEAENSTHDRFSRVGLRAIFFVRPIDGCQNSKRNEVDEWHEGDQRPQWREAKSAEDAPYRIDDSHNHGDEEQPMQWPETHSTRPPVRIVRPPIHHDLILSRAYINICTI